MEIIWQSVQKTCIIRNILNINYGGFCLLFHLINHHFLHLHAILFVRHQWNPNSLLFRHIRKPPHICCIIWTRPNRKTTYQRSRQETHVYFNKKKNDGDVDDANAFANGNATLNTNATWTVISTQKEIAIDGDDGDVSLDLIFR